MRQVLGPGALGRPRGIGWRGRWEGGLGWGTHVNPWLIHVNVWQKPLQYCKVISLQLIKINGKKKILRVNGTIQQSYSVLIPSLPATLSTLQGFPYLGRAVKFSQLRSVTPPKSQAMGTTSVNSTLSQALCLLL